MSGLALCALAIVQGNQAVLPLDTMVVRVPTGEHEIDIKTCSDKVQSADLTCDVIKKVALFVLSKL